MSKDNGVRNDYTIISQTRPNDKLRILTNQAEMEQAMFIIYSQVRRYKIIQNTRNFKHTPHKLS